MSLHLYNTFSKREEEFVPLEKGTVRMYTCGPTVYGRPHIGNYASFLMADLVRRWLEVCGYTVLHVKNITDVGHMVADRDSGEDKVEKQAKLEKEGKQSFGNPMSGSSETLEPEDVLSIARKYETQYLEDEAALCLLEPHKRPRASETIAEMIEIIQRLLEKGLAYETDDGIYFSIERFPEYGRLSGNTLENLDKLQEGVRIDLRESKKHPADFALWKKRVGKHEKHVLHWPSPWGEGFPGWHIECSAMSMKHLGMTLDIHTGGEDNIFPHHECEIAQSEGAHNVPFVRYWLHKRRVNFGDPSMSSGQAQKMSKSLGNILTLPDIVKNGFHPLDLRYFLLAAHYRSHTTFSWKGLEDAKKARQRILEWIEEFPPLSLSQKESSDADRTRSASSKIQHYTERFTHAMNADMNTPEALAVIFDCMAWSRSTGGERLTALQDFLRIIAYTFGCFEAEAIALPFEVQELVRKRKQAREAGDFTLSDRLRTEAGERGFILEDTETGTKITPRDRRQ